MSLLLVLSCGFSRANDIDLETVRNFSTLQNGANEELTVYTVYDGTFLPCR